MRWTAALVIFVGSSACESTVDIELPTRPPELVVHGFFTPDSLWSVHLDRTLSVSSREDARLAYVSDAHVVIEDGEGLQETLRHVGEGLYRSTRAPRPVEGMTYTLRAHADGLPAVQASSSIPSATVRLAVLEDAVPSGRPRAERLSLRLSITDPPQPTYYALRVLQLTPVTTDEFGYRRIEDKPGNPVDFWEISFRMVSRFFLRDTDTDELSGERDILEFYQRVSFGDGPFESKTADFDITIYPETFETVESEFLLVLSALSPDYHLYHDTVRFQRETGAYVDALSAYFEPVPPVNVYSNVEDGLGVFAGYAVHAFGFDLEGNVWER